MLGMEVIWLNLLAFILSSMLVKVRLAKRMALWLITRFGRKAPSALLAFVIIQLVLAPLIPATAARAVMTLPLMIVVAAIYGATEETNNNFGRNLFLLNLMGISVLSSMTMTGSSANLIAVGLIETMGGERVYYVDWARLGAPIAVTTMLLMWVIGRKWLFPIPAAEQVPQLDGGLDVVRAQYAELGPMRSRGKEGARHLRPRALPLDDRRLPHALVRRGDRRRLRRAARRRDRALPALRRAAVVRSRHPVAPADLQCRRLRRRAGARRHRRGRVGGPAPVRRASTCAACPSGSSYTVVIAVMMYSHLLTTSKTVRTLIMMPIIITLAKTLGWSPIAFALPAALCIDWVVGLPISGKPNVILFSTNQYSVIDNLKYGLVTCTIGFLLLVVSAATWFHWIGLTPAFWAVAP